MFFKKNWSPTGLHCYVTGGSTGLGLGLALILARNGAHVSIVARSQENLDKALSQLETVRQSDGQKFKVHSFSLATFAESKAALEAVCEPFDGLAPDAVFMCAGASKPMFFLDMDEDDLVNGMVTAYWVQAFTAHAVTQKMVRQKRKGKLVLVSSTAGYAAFIGYASYAPGKHALRALGDGLRSELLLYGIQVQTYFPATMYSPGYETEQLTKPDITKEIEKMDKGQTPEEAAAYMYAGVIKGQTHITGDWLTDLFRVSTRSATPLNSIWDFFLNLASFIILLIARHTVDNQVIAHIPAHEEYLVKQNFFEKS